ncbi:MAG: polyprenol monophosphomannose synthase [Chlorobi bacterium]|nr:polyprenol monophosphomannose synthase [Chlorobiota bacterium]
MKKVLVIIPTYNERTNIENMIEEVLSLPGELEILVVDDNSPDGTGEYVKEVSQRDSRVHVLQREGKMGLGTAYVAGFKYMLSNNYDIAVQMDADFSHDPKVIPEFLKSIEENDLVIGSRYIQGVNVINWPMKRLLLSYFANIYTKVITGMPVKDATGGFKCFRREVLESINLDNIHSNGYSFQIEMNFKTFRKGFRCKEIPIIFMDRVEGESKMSKKIVREAITMVWKLRFKAVFGTLN